MKRYALIIIALLSVAAGAQELPKIAVYVTGGRNMDENKALATFILDALIRSGKYVAIERMNDFVEQIDREQITQFSGAVDDNQIRQAGMRAGVQFVCVSDISRAFGSYQVSARIIDVETARVIGLGVSNSNMMSMDEMESVSKEVVKLMLDPNARRTKKKETVAPDRSGYGGSGRRGHSSAWLGNAVGVRLGIGNAIDVDGILTFMYNDRKNRADILVGYHGFKYKYNENDSYNYIGYNPQEITGSFPALEVVIAPGRLINITSDGIVSGYINPAVAGYFIDGFGLGFGGQIGVEYNLEGMLFGIDFRPMYCIILGSREFFGYVYTIGLNAKYRI